MWFKKVLTSVFRYVVVVLFYRRWKERVCIGHSLFVFLSHITLRLEGMVNSVIPFAHWQVQP